MTLPVQPHSPARASLTDDDVARFLLRSPDFFVNHPDVLARLKLSDSHGGRTISLHEHQIDLLRDRIKALEQRIALFKRHAQDNMAITEKVHDWTLSLLNTADPADLPAVLVRDLSQRFGLPHAAIRVWDVAPAWIDQPFAQGCSNDVRLFADSLKEPYCGANPGVEAAGWLDEPESIRSLALIALRQAPGARAFGLLVIGSPDTQRFERDMEVDFLVRMGQLASAALVRLRTPA